MKFQTWKTIKLGTKLKTSDDFRKSLTSMGYAIGRLGANELLDHPSFAVANAPIDVELVNVSVTELGLCKERTHPDQLQAAEFKSVYIRAKEFGLGTCPPEVGPQLRLQYRDQPKMENESLRIGMEPLSINADKFPYPDRNLFVFALKHQDSGIWLLADMFVRPNDCAYDNQRYVFLQSKE